MMRSSLSIAFISVFALAAFGQQGQRPSTPQAQPPQAQSQQQTQQQGNWRPPMGRRENDMLMRNYKPKSMLHVPAHEIKRAKFPVIDVHQHVNDAGMGGGDHVAPQKLLAMMDELNIKSMVILTGGWGEALQKVVDEMVKPYPGRFHVYVQLDYTKVNDPDFSKLMAAQIRDAVKRGARGLKITKDLGLWHKDASGKLIPIDDPRFDPIWAECGKLHIPVAIHIGDPEAFFKPIDRFNERYDELGRHPDWGFCCQPEFPPLEELIKQRDRMIAKHPDTTFIVLHVGNWPENLDDVERMLDRFPNTYVELGARQAELGRQPRRALAFFRKNPDRIMFGTDIDPNPVMYRSYFRWLETDDEYFEYYGYPGQGFWNIYGLGLPDDVLEKVYHKNAERISAQFKGVPR